MKTVLAIILFYSLQVNYLTMYENVTLRTDVEVLKAEILTERSTRTRMMHYVETKYAEYVTGRTEEVRRLVNDVENAAREFSIDPRLLIAQMSVESAFRPSAISNKGAVGLMQVMPFWVQSERFRKSTGILTPDGLENPTQNIRAGAWIIAEYIKQCGGIENGIRCYHGGPRALVSPDASTLAYAGKVLARYYSI